MILNIALGPSGLVTTVMLVVVTVTWPATVNRRLPPPTRLVLYKDPL